MQRERLKNVLMQLFFWVVPLILAWVVFRPIGLDIQYSVPDDGGGEIGVLVASLPMLGLAIGLAQNDLSLRRRMLCSVVIVSVLPFVYGVAADVLLEPPDERLKYLAIRMPFFAIAIFFVAVCATPFILIRLPSWLRTGFFIRPVFSFILALHVGFAWSVVLPEVSRTIGPWATIRTALYEEADRFQRTAIESGVELSTEMSDDDWARVKARFQVRKIRWPGRSDEVQLRPMSSVYPYVGIDYGKGRNCTFELPSMRSTYCD
jgi:hypothetical protein